MEKNKMAADVGWFVAEKPSQASRLPPDASGEDPGAPEPQQPAVNRRRSQRFFQTVKAVMRENKDDKQDAARNPSVSSLDPRRPSIRPGGTSTTTDIWALVARRGSNLLPQAGGGGGWPDPGTGPSGGRRPSHWLRRPSVAGSTARGSQSGQGSQPEPPPPSVHYQNSCRIAPERVLVVDSVAKVLRQVLESYLAGETYDARRSVGMATQLSDVIKQRVKKEAELARHKIVCCVLIGQSAGQSVAVTSRCLWDERFDNFADATYKNRELFAVAIVYTVYHE